MFRWLRRARRFDGPLTTKMVPELLGAYGALLEDLASDIVTDVSKLPTSKDRLVIALKAAWLSCKNDEIRSAIEASWISLSTFQENVGDVKLQLPNPEFVRGADMTKLLPKLDAVATWMAIVSAESSSRLREIEAFRTENSN